MMPSLNDDALRLNQIEFAAEELYKAAKTILQILGGGTHVGVPSDAIKQLEEAVKLAEGR
jgi:hypothetical protein